MSTNKNRKRNTTTEKINVSLDSRVIFLKVQLLLLTNSAAAFLFSHTQTFFSHKKFRTKRVTELSKWSERGDGKTRSHHDDASSIQTATFAERHTFLGVLSVFSLFFWVWKELTLFPKRFWTCFAKKTTVMKFSKETFTSFLGCSSFKHSNNYTPYGTPKSFLEGFPVFALAESLFFWKHVFELGNPMFIMK